MNAADIAILAVLLLSMLFGLLRGFVSAVLSLACWVAAFWVTWEFGHVVADWYGAWLQEPAARIVAGYVTCFVGVLLIGALLGWLARGLMNRGGLRGGDRVLGAAFGVVRGWLLVTFVVLMLGFTGVPRDAGWWRDSTLLPAFIGSATWLADELPPNVTHYLALGGQALPALSHVPISTLQRTLAPSTSVKPPPRASAASASPRALPHGPVHADVGQ